MCSFILLFPLRGKVILIKIIKIFISFKSKVITIDYRHIRIQKQYGVISIKCIQLILNL